MTFNAAQVRPYIVAALLFAIWLAMLTLGAGNVDRDVLLALHADNERAIADAAVWLTILGNWWTVVPVTLAGAAWLFYKRRRWPAVALLACSFGGRVLVILQKDYFARMRPEEHLRMVEVHYMSFPSGHATNAIVAYFALALLAFEDPQRRRIAVACTLVLALLIGLSRPVLGVHWPSDVIAGWSFGLLWVGVVLAVLHRKLQPHGADQLSSRA
jgi:membrane-associated phospholipid phosphatase